MQRSPLRPPARDPARAARRRFRRRPTLALPQVAVAAVVAVVAVVAALTVAGPLPPVAARDGSTIQASGRWRPAALAARLAARPRWPRQWEQAVSGPPRRSRDGASSPPRPGGAAPALARPPVLRPPVDGPLLRGFEESAGPFGPGHRGVDFGAAPGTPVRAPVGGRVTFAGRVAGANWVTIEVPRAVLVTLGPLGSVATSAGRAIATGGPVGTSASGHLPALLGQPRGGPPDPGLAALHLGLRLDGVYLDPLPWLAGLGRPRLAPLAEPGGRP